MGRLTHPGTKPAKAVKARHRVGGDIGGTFTDIVIEGPDGSALTKKVLSTTEDFSRGLVDGMLALLADKHIESRAVTELIHGTTVATNAILQQRGALTGLITTRGFRDVLELRRLRVPHLYDLVSKPPQPLVERRLRLEADERMGPRGDVITPLDESSVLRAVDRLLAEGVEAVAVCLLHSYRNPSHEARVGQIVRQLMPNAYLALSVEVLPEIREYERTSTTVINAYLGPIVGSYLMSFLQRLHAADVEAPLLVMQSSGGLMSAGSAVHKPAHIVESGPAAGVIAAQVVGRQTGLNNLITFDMGGTTAKASIIEGGRVSRTTESEVGAGISLSSRLIKGAGHPLKLPVLDIAEVGAGGGSIVWLDRGGNLKVGPISAGATPGPACYGGGGTAPTVTDASVVLGYINPEKIAGGALRIDAGLARSVIGDKVARPLGMDLLGASYGVFEVVNANMIRAIKAVSTYRGRDPRDFALLAFGGCGPIHGVAVASQLGIGQVIVPPAPGLFSAIGLLQAPVEHHLIQAFFARLDQADVDAVVATYRHLEARAGTLLAQDGHGDGAVQCQWLADMRYVGQSYELSVPVPGRLEEQTHLAHLAELFGQEHERTYGHRAESEPVELVNLRLIARVAGGAHQVIRSVTNRASRGSHRLAYFGPTHGQLPTPVLSRADLSPSPRPGPLIVEDYDATTTVPPGSAAALDRDGNIAIEVRAGVS